MKLFKIFSVILLTLSTFFFTACNSDDDTIPKKLNEIKIGAKSFEIKNSVLIKKGTHNDITYFTLYLSSSGLTIDASEDPQGSGDILAFQINSDEQTKLTEGTYTVNDQSNSSFIIEKGFHFIGFDASLGDNQTGNIDIKSGSITVTSNTNEYTITITLVDKNGTNVIGYYKGSIPILNYDAP